MSTNPPAQSATVRQFIHALDMLPDNATHEDVDHALIPALEYEQFMRVKLDQRPYIGLLNVFDIPSHCRRSHVRDGNSNEDHLFPYNEDDLPLDHFTWVDDFEGFTRNFDIFSHGVLRSFNEWDNVIIAGGSVLVSLLCSNNIPQHDLARIFHSPPYDTSDIDIFLWGLSPAEAEKKIVSIFKAVKSSVPWEVVAVRKTNTISIHTQYPHRPLQIVLRLYQTPTEIMIGFDIDCCSVCYDGKSVWASPRALASIVTKRLTVDITRRSPSYELRLAKYTRRGFEVYYPKLQRWNIDPRLYEQNLVTLPTGLARLLVLERMYMFPGHYRYLQLPAKPPKSLATGLFPLLTRGLDVDEYTSNYECAAFQIPYGLNWDAKCIKKLAKRTENWLAFLRLTSDGYLHRHVMRADDDVKDCFKDVCDSCPEPRDEQELQEQARNDARYIRGPLRFITRNPGHQLVTGSFNPINDGEWEEGAYIAN